MKKFSETFSTSKSKIEIITQIKYLKDNYAKLIFEDTVVYPVHFTNHQYFRVAEGRGATEWILDLETPGKITVERRITFWDWVLIVTFAFIDLVLGFLFLYGGVSLVGLLILIGLIAGEAILWYFCNVVSPIRKMRKLVNKYLGGL